MEKTFEQYSKKRKAGKIWAEKLEKKQKDLYMQSAPMHHTKN